MRGMYRRRIMRPLPTPIKNISAPPRQVDGETTVYSPWAWLAAMAILGRRQGDRLGRLCLADSRTMSYQRFSEVSQGDLRLDASQITLDDPFSAQPSMTEKTVALS